MVVPLGMMVILAVAVIPRSKEGLTFPISLALAEEKDDNRVSF